MMTLPPPDLPDDDPLISMLREAQAKPDPARAQALEDKLTARLHQLTSQSERKPDMQAQLVYTRRPSAQTTRTWGGLIAAAVTLAACVALVMVAFPRQTPPPSDNNVAAPIGVNQDPTAPPFPTLLPATVVPTTTPMDGGMMPTMPPTSTPLPGQGSFETIPADVTPTPTMFDGLTIPSDVGLETATPVPFGFAIPTPTPLPYNGMINPIITLSSKRLFHVGIADEPLTIELGVTLALYLPVVTVTDLPDADLYALIAANVVELLPIGRGEVVGVRPDGSLQLQLDDMLTVNGSAWTRDSNVLIGFTVIEQ